MVDILKQSTAINVLVYLVDSADHLSPALGLTPTIYLSKDNTLFSTITPSITEKGYGWYQLALTTTHTNTLGTLIIHATGSQTDPCDKEYRVDIDNFNSVVNSTWDEVLTAASHNIVNSAARKLRQLSSNIIYDGVITSASNNRIAFDGGASTGDGAYDPALIVITTGSGIGQTRLILEYFGNTKTAVIDRDFKIIPSVGDECMILADPGREHVNEGLVRSGSALDVQLNALASDTDGEYVGQVMFVRSGTGEDQARRITGYVGATKVASTRKTWNPILDETSAYVMLPTAELDIDKVYAGVTDAVWNEAMSGHTGSGTSGCMIQSVENTVWDAQLTAHTDNGSAGERMVLNPTAATIASNVWNESLSGHTGSGTAGAALSTAGVASDPWSASVRTLTIPVIENTTASATDINCMRGDTFYTAISGMGDMTGWNSVYFTVKDYYKKDTDAQSIFQVVKISGSSGSSGLLYLNSASVVDMTAGSITVLDTDDGNITVMVKPDATKDLVVKDNCYYDVQVIYNSGSILTLADGTFNILGDVTRAIV